LTRSRPERALLEFGVGTGRLALPLVRLGLDVAGIDGSEQMVSQLRDKPGGSRIAVTIGDYRSARLPGRLFSVVLLAINGIFDPRGLDAQLDIFRNAASHLGPGGFFVLETWVMTDAQRNGSWSVLPRFVGDRHVELQMARFDIDRNSIERTLVHIRTDGMKFVSVTDTYASPGELDIMARVTGFRRCARFGAWDGAPFSVASTNCVSVYERRAD
jgi:SAM-dependent methyltransferase